MNKLKNTTLDYKLFENEFGQLVCPTPEFEDILQVVRSEEAFVPVVNKCLSNLASGVYFLGLLLNDSNYKKQNYICTEDDLSQFLVDGTGLMIVYGDLTITGDLNLEEYLLVLGNLTVEGVYNDIEDCSQLVVMGDFSCDTLNTTIWVIIGGDCNVTGYFYGYYNDDAFECLGNLKAKAVVSEEHEINLGSISVEILPPNFNKTDDEIFNIRKTADRKLLKKLHDEQMDKAITMKILRNFD